MAVQSAAQAETAEGAGQRPESSVGDGPSTPRKLGRRRPKSTVGAIVELIVIIAVALGLAFGIQEWIVKPYRVPSRSMEPTLEIGQRYLVNRIGAYFSKPHVGEIAVFHPPEGAKEEECGPTPHVIKLGGTACPAPVPRQEKGEPFVKRIVAGPGDEMYIEAGQVYRRAAGKSTFVRETDSYIKPCPKLAEVETTVPQRAPLAPIHEGSICNFPVPIKIPPGHWFMMGDNRSESDDSRFWGPVPTSWIIGQAIATYWPPDRIGLF
jgi:signal peptidase I